MNKRLYPNHEIFKSNEDRCVAFQLFAQRCVLAQQFQISITESLRQTFCPKLVQLSQFDNAIIVVVVVVEMHILIRMLEKHA
ncbi:hypothetical protein T01_1878 [Trichinella spiralis]|uniref:Uncharacterized protein n=1 Tax=Trichinella spiralis TaxID=6334 RepID=A0A0V1BBQ0_TRISP|nr:hypothetical protein T01_1878 [Trichinella spiralis]